MRSMLIRTGAFSVAASALLRPAASGPVPMEQVDLDCFSAPLD